MKQGKNLHISKFSIKFSNKALLLTSYWIFIASLGYSCGVLFNVNTVFFAIVVATLVLLLENLQLEMIRGGVSLMVALFGSTSLVLHMHNQSKVYNGVQLQEYFQSVFGQGLEFFSLLVSYIDTLFRYHNEK